MDNKLIYIADDEVHICNIIKSFLIKAGFSVKAFSDGQSILDAFNIEKPDMFILDILMPNLNGYELCSLIRSQSSIPIIFVSAKDTEFDKISGLKLGGDDYLTKPFSPLELIARINSIFRRIDLDKDFSSNSNNNLIFIGDISIDPNIKQAYINKNSLNLTTMEFSLLFYLVQNQNRAISRIELLKEIWGFENSVETRATDDMIKRIRKKLINTGSRLKIRTIWGFGFALEYKE